MYIKKYICFLYTRLPVCVFLWQGYGRSLWLMQGLFRANGGCGFVRKPDFLMKVGPHGEVFDPEASLPVKITLKVDDTRRTLSISIYAHFTFFSELWSHGRLRCTWEMDGAWTLVRHILMPILLQISIQR